MDYKSKLIEWNSKDKYHSEFLFLNKLVGKGQSILDYGCGLGLTAVGLGADGYDVNDYIFSPSIKSIGNYYINELPNKAYQEIYFMHSIAHIPNPIEVLKDLKARYSATITVITPNRYWLMQQSNRDYKPDPTVHKHYTLHELRELFEQAGYEVTLIGQFGELNNGVNERIFLQAR